MKAVDNLGKIIYKSINEAFDFNSEINKNSDILSNVEYNDIVLKSINYEKLIQTYNSLTSILIKPSRKSHKDIMNAWNNFFDAVKECILQLEHAGIKKDKLTYQLILAKHKFHGYGLSSLITDNGDLCSNIPWMSGYPWYNPDFKPDNIELDLWETVYSAHAQPYPMIIDIPITVYIIFLLHYLKWTETNNISFAQQLPLIGIKSSFFQKLLDKWKANPVLSKDIRNCAKYIDNNAITSRYRKEKALM